MPSPLPQIVDAISSCKVLHIYPDPTQTYFRRALSGFLRVPEDFICGGTGSDELLDLVLRLFEPAALVNLPPTFGMYPFLVRALRRRHLSLLHCAHVVARPYRASSHTRGLSTSTAGPRRPLRCTLKVSLLPSRRARPSSLPPLRTTRREAC